MVPASPSATSTAAASSAAAWLVAASSAAASVAGSSVAASSISSRSDTATFFVAGPAEDPAATVSSASSTTNATTGSIVSPCTVCAVKAAGERIPKRKCTCDSGSTKTRVVCHRELSRLQERQRREAYDIMFDDSYDLEDESDEEAFLDKVTDFENLLLGALKSRNVDELRLLGKPGIGTRSSTWETVWRNAVMVACERGHVDVLAYLLDECGAPVDQLCPYHEGIDSSMTEGLMVYEWDTSVFQAVPNPAPALFIAVTFDQLEAVSFLLDRGADVNAAAFDGCTPVHAACVNNNLESLRVLYAHGADLTKADQDGTQPVHIAALYGHLDVMTFLAANGVDTNVRGTAYVQKGSSVWEHQLRDATPLMMAQHESNWDVVAFLQSPPGPAPVATPKRARSNKTMQERAELVGVAHRLKPIPPNVSEAMRTGSDGEKIAAKKLLQKLQIANQQIVARAEQARIKQTKLL